jgi:Fic family protein
MYQVLPLPLPIFSEIDIENKEILKKTTLASRALAELKSISKTIPNEAILLNTLILQEAKDSSAIENIITTHDELFISNANETLPNSLAIKEVENYANALKRGYEIVKNNNILTPNHIISIHERLENNNAGFRIQTGTTIKNTSTGEIIYTPPQNSEEINRLMDNLALFINDNEISDFDPLVKMAIIHFQFESIHPFYDGNGRTGRIINILYLILQGLLDTPILYLSKFIIKNKQKYYQTLQNVRDKNEWHEWILFILDGIEKISFETTHLIGEIKSLMQDYKHKIREKYPFYSQELLNNLFKHPYTKIEFLLEDTKVSRQTASTYLNTLAEDGFLKKIKIGKNNFYINEPLYKLFINS